jgi:hydroxymethylpyrimidine/phosphomethylpyrimidine kinase
MRTVLTIAGSDSSGGAGIQADLKTFAALGVYGTSAVTAITAQNTTGVVAAEAVAADLVTAQIEAVAADGGIDAVKTGMLANAAVVEAVAATIEELELPNLVVDPVMVSTSGTRLLDLDGVQVLMSELLPRARVVTPNVPEAEALSGVRIGSLDDARRAARQIRALGPTAVVVTGGHASWTASHGHDEVVDLVFDGRSFHELRAPRIRVSGTHGSGCTYAAALAAYLAAGRALPDAARRAQRFVAGAIRRRVTVGRGDRVLNQFWTRS